MTAQATSQFEAASAATPQPQELPSPHRTLAPGRYGSGGGGSGGGIPMLNQWPLP